MTPEQMHDLQRGDIVRNAGSGTTYVVLLSAAETGAHPVVTRTISVSNPQEWELVAVSDSRQESRRGD